MSGRDERRRPPSGDPTMLLLDEAAAEERVRRRLHAPAPTQAEVGAYDDGYEDDSSAAFVARTAIGRGAGEGDGPPRLRVLPEDRTERVDDNALRPREERSSGRLLGGLRQRLQQIEQEDFSGGALDGDPRPGLLRSPLLRAAGPLHPDEEESSSDLGTFNQLQEAAGKAQLPWWAELPEEQSANATTADLAPFGPLAGRPAPGFEAPSSNLRAELEARRPIEREEPLLKPLDEQSIVPPSPHRDAGGAEPARSRLAPTNLPPRIEARRPSRAPWIAAAVGILALGLGGWAWSRSKVGATPAAAPAEDAALAAAEPSAAPGAAPSPQTGGPAAAPAADAEINVVVADGAEEVPAVTSIRASSGASSGASTVASTPAEGAAGAPAAEPAPPAPAMGAWDQLVDRLATWISGPQAAPKPKVEVVAVTPVPTRAAAAPVAEGPPQGTLFVRTKQQADIFVDGKAVGEAPGLKLALEPGWYTVKAVPRGEGHTWTARTRIDADMQREVALDLSQAPPPPLKRREQRGRR
ncbi:MAG: hypothetical protein JNM72_03950 [Deltaproteobacteria bacterium]|nr:hypothetical protein [Deltaproteobacteria bacterium]